MIRTFIFKEIGETLLGPKFLITFVISLVLMLSSVYSGYSLYESERTWFATAQIQNRERLENLGGYGALRYQGTKVLREPTRMSIFVKGVDSAIGRAAMVGDDSNITLRDSRYGLNPIFAVFGDLDPAFIVKMVLSLFALLYSYNAISGERETGTLKQVFANSISRASYITGKAIGGFVPLLLTLLIPFLISLLMLMLFFNVAFSAEEYARLGMMLAAFSLYLGVFFMAGMLMSALTRQSSVSFLLCLFFWVLCVVVLPKAAVEVAGRLSPAPSIDQVEAQRTALRRNFYAGLQERLQSDTQRMLEAGTDQQKVQEHQRQVQEEMQAQAQEEERKFFDDYRRSQENLLRTSESLARVSPTSCVTFAVDRLAQTDSQVGNRFIEYLSRYRQEFLQYALEKLRNNPDKGGSGVSISSSVSTDNDKRTVSVKVTTPSTRIDVNDMPRFTAPAESLATAASTVLADLAILAVELFGFFAAAFVVFLRYDVR